jgi:hypothetical protein
MNSVFIFSILFLIFIYFWEKSDGAAALVLVSGGKAKELGLQIIARIRSFADAAQVPLNSSFR